MTPVPPSTTGSLLLRWFDQNRRPLPWRSRRTPYSVWVSEIMLQQTTVATVIPRYKAWMRKYPTVRRLAAASEREILRAWEGLGYYSRARNLLKAARLIVKDGNGRVPDEFDDLRKLPGIGDYTASAVLSIAFNKPYPVIDANVKRVTARLFNRGTGTTGFDTFIGHKLRELLPGDRPGDFNEAVMELGQTVCLNRDPLCGRCPLSAGCGALKAGAQDKVLGRKTRKITHLKTRVLVLVKEGRVMLQRSETNLMRSLWKFPGIPLSEPVRTSLKRLGLMLVRQGEALHPLVHHYTVHREELLPVMIDVRGKGEKSDSVRWARLNNLGKYPMPSVYRKIASAVSGMRA